MSRFFLLAVLFVLLSLVSARTIVPSSSIVTPANPATPSAAAPAACLNSCSSHGNCTTAGAVSTCLCEYGYLGADCSVMSVMKPLCWLNETVCSYWQIVDGTLYQRVISRDGKGWVGVMWGSTDGMSGGQSTIMTVPTSLLPTVWEGYNMKKGKPANTTGQSIMQANVTGSITPMGHLDVSFSRPLKTGLDEHFVIPSTPGTMTNMSVARGSVVFDFHGGNATFFKIDIAGAAAGQLQVQEVEKVEEETTSLLGRLMKLITGQ